MLPRVRRFPFSSANHTYPLSNINININRVIIIISIPFNTNTPLTLDDHVCRHNHRPPSSSLPIPAPNLHRSSLNYRPSPPRHPPVAPPPPHHPPAEHPRPRPWPSPNTMPNAPPINFTARSRNQKLPNIVKKYLPSMPMLCLP